MLHSVEKKLQVIAPMDEKNHDTIVEQGVTR